MFLVVLTANAVQVNGQLGSQVGAGITERVITFPIFAPFLYDPRGIAVRLLRLSTGHSTCVP